MYCCICGKEGASRRNRLYVRDDEDGFTEEYHFACNHCFRNFGGN